MGAASAWKHFLELLNEADASVLVNNVTFWILAGLYGMIALAAFVQLVRIHVRVPEYGMTTQKLFHILNCITAAARCVVFALWYKIIAIGKDSGGSTLVNVLLDFPSLLFFTTYTLLVLFWSEIYNQARSMSTSMLRPIFIIINAFVYIVTASVWTWMLIVENTEKHGSADAQLVTKTIGLSGQNDINVHVLGFRITSIFLAAMSVLVVISFLFYGLKLYYMLKKFPLESKGRKKKLYEVGVVTATCCFAFTVRAIMIAVNAFVKEVELDVFGHPIYNFLYYSLTEIIPAVLVLWVLRKMPARRANANTNPSAVRRGFFGWISGRRATDDTAYEPIPVQP